VECNRFAWIAYYPAKDRASNDLYNGLQWLESLEGQQSKDSGILYLVTLQCYPLLTRAKGRIITPGRMSESASQILRKVDLSTIDISMEMKVQIKRHERCVTP
jgi:hypothetical protein